MINCDQEAFEVSLLNKCLNSSELREFLETYFDFNQGVKIFGYFYFIITK